MRIYRSFSYKEANFRIASPFFDIITMELCRQRKLLDRYIRRHPLFQLSMEPVQPLPGAPPIAVIMAEAGKKAGTGPMAAVAGAMAQAGVQAALTAGAEEAIVENGGDIFLTSPAAVYIGLYPGNSSLSGKLAFRIAPEDMPLAVCSSSSYMGHSKSFGKCDLATVMAKEAALADTAATQACNMVRSKGDIDTALEKIGAIEGIMGLLIVKGEFVGKAGWLPELVKNADPGLEGKITRF